MKGKIEIYKTETGTEISVRFDEDTVWLNQQQMALLFKQTKQNISLHINNCFKEGELDKTATVKKSLTVQKEGKRTVKRIIEYYNLDVIISVGYRVKSLRGTQFRIWATQRLKDYLVRGYAINEKRLAEKQQEIQYLRDGLHILNRAIEEKSGTSKEELLSTFDEGLKLLDAYDHHQLEGKGETGAREVYYPDESEYLEFIQTMYRQQPSGIFARPKDNSFASSVNQIRATFDGKDLYPTLEEKAANLLYLIVKNHSFVDGNKRIAAACFIYFLDKNNMLFGKNSTPVLSNNSLAALTLFIAVSLPEEKESVIRLIITILNKVKK